MNTIDEIKDQIANNPIILYMKGTPEFPNCGFSAQAVEILSICNQQYAYIDILKFPLIRKELPKYANWPTFPQLWINGELIGGCDIIVEMFKSGKLQILLNSISSKKNNKNNINNK
ncbi:Glutaredoxin-related protein [Candidatus Purcelliella pentastirinorum]|uniref:Glutaredoxin n=1 Tax=Candidatus Purcelliella pentastirinorum TaxID=472834 RepID=A0A346DZ74_9ENTR|nr:Grx4 family monothiol glutaredoxin [Candidatus Purcelliella pentastirinorum]AXN02029.1 Glutaredoxin-related protein [Candidatus Purcelliella pentastirinorum]